MMRRAENGCAGGVEGWQGWIDMHASEVMSSEGGEWY